MTFQDKYAHLPSVNPLMRKWQPSAVAQWRRELARGKHRYAVGQTARCALAATAVFGLVHRPFSPAEIGLNAALTAAGFYLIFLWQWQRNDRSFRKYLQLMAERAGGGIG